MKKDSVIFFLLLIVDKGKSEDRPLETQNDINEYQINAIFEMFQMFNWRPSQDSIDKWISQQKTLETTPEFINSKKIYFSKFVPEVKMDTLSDAEIICNFGDKLRIEFESNSPKSLKISPEGDIEFLDSGNLIWCRAHLIFKYGLELKSIEIRITNKITHDYSCDYELDHDLNAVYVKYDESVCKNITENLIQSTHKDVLRAIENRLEKRCKLMQISQYQLMFNQCTSPQESNYIFWIETDSNMAAFPWTSDHNELVIKGLTSFSSLYSVLSYNYFFLTIKSAEIRWYVKSTVMQEYNIKIHELLVRIGGKIENFIDDLTLEVSFGLAFEKRAGYTKILDNQFRRRLETILKNGIKETYTDTLHITRKFIDTISKILKPFDKQKFKQSFVDLETMAQDSPLSDTISLIKIETEGFHLENITCVPDNEDITTLKYKKLSGQLSYLHPVKKEELHILRISADVYIKEAIMRILQQRYSEYTNETEIQIYDNFNNTEIVIQVTSEFYHLSRGERISIGTKIFNHFVNTIKSKILHTAKTTFLPMLNVCENLRNRSSGPHSNPSSDSLRYFAIIRDYWVNSMDPFSTSQIHVILNGSWNFNFINVQYANENVIVDGLRMENVVGRINIKKNVDRNEITTLNYNMDYFSLIINHTDKNIQVRVPQPANYSVVSAKSNIPLSAQQAADITEKFQYTVASYIEQSIYSNSEYHAKFRKDIKQIIAKAVEDTSAELDASSKFTTWIAKSLKKWIDEYNSIFHYDDKRIGILSVGGNNLSTDTYRSLPVIYEMIYDHSDHAEVIMIPKSKNMYFKEQLNMRGAIKIDCDWAIRFIIGFEMRRICGTLDKEYNNEIKLLVDRENIQFQVLWKGWSNFTLNDVWRDTLVQHTSEYIDRNPGHFPGPALCESSFAALELSERHLYSINGTIEYSSDDVFMYHITLYGLHNLKSFHNNITNSLYKFEITATNLTLHIKWIQNIGGLPSRIPKEMILKIDKITLTGEIVIFNYNVQQQVIFTDQSQLQFSDHQNTETIEKLKETIAPVVLESIQSSIYQVYTRFDINIIKKVKYHRTRYLPT